MGGDELGVIRGFGCVGYADVARAPRVGGGGGENLLQGGYLRVARDGDALVPVRLHYLAEVGGDKGEVTGCLAVVGAGELEDVGRELDGKGVHGRSTSMGDDRNDMVLVRGG